MRGRPLQRDGAATVQRHLSCLRVSSPLTSGTSQLFPRSVSGGTQRASLCPTKSGRATYEHALSCADRKKPTTKSSCSRVLKRTATSATLTLCRTHLRELSAWRMPLKTTELRLLSRGPWRRLRHLGSEASGVYGPLSERTR